jgi:hypothetical protein
MSDVFQSVLPRKDHIAFAVQVECLVYPTSYSDVNRISDFLFDSIGRWQRFAYEIERKRSQANGLFDNKIIRDLYAVASLIPAIGRWICRLNEKLLPSTKRVPTGHYLINRPHSDGGKYLTALIGERDNVRTDVFGRRQWVQLPISDSTLAIYQPQNSLQGQGFSPQFTEYSSEKIQMREILLNKTLP